MRCDYFAAQIKETLSACLAAVWYPESGRSGLHGSADFCNAERPGDCKSGRTEENFACHFICSEGPEPEIANLTVRR